jgi:hypothetical protein
MILPEEENRIGQGLPFYEVYHPDDVAGGVADRKSMHKARVIYGKIKDSRLFLRASVTIEDDIPYLGFETLMENEFYDLDAPVGKIAGALDPVFLLVVDTEAPLPFVISDEIWSVTENNHIIVIDPEKIRSVGYDFELFRDLFRAYPARDEISQFVATELSKLRVQVPMHMLYYRISCFAPSLYQYYNGCME